MPILHITTVIVRFKFWLYSICTVHVLRESHVITNLPPSSTWYPKWNHDTHLLEYSEQCSLNVFSTNLQKPVGRLRVEVMKNVCMITIYLITCITESHTPFGRVATWVRETARKTVRIFTSFRDKFWRDELEDQENDISSPVCEHTDMQKQRQQLDKVQ